MSPNPDTHTTEPDLQPDQRSRRDDDGFTRDDDGFSLAQVLVTMILIGILSVTVGITAFELLGQGRETVLRSNITTAAQAVETTLALNPAALGAQADVVARRGTGEPTEALIDALTQIAALEWAPAAAAPAVAPALGERVWELPADAGVDRVSVQMINAGTDNNDNEEAAVDDTTTGTVWDPTAPVVPWLNNPGGAIRIQIRNTEGDWACALIVMRPNGDPGPRGQIRGIWYDAGRDIEDGGLLNCSPGGATGADHRPASATAWTVSGRTFSRTIPPFDG